MPRAFPVSLFHLIFRVDIAPSPGRVEPDLVNHPALTLRLVAFSPLASASLSSLFLLRHRAARTILPAVPGPLCRRGVAPLACGTRTSLPCPFSVRAARGVCVCVCVTRCDRASSASVCHGGMGASSSVAGHKSGTGETAAASPPCPLFYNHMPDNQLIPASTLPARGPDGCVRRPQGGCAARVVPLRRLPIVSEEAKRQANQTLADAKKGVKVEGGAGAAARGGGDAQQQQARVVAEANALLHNPSLPPALSSCFLINIAVDEQGRLAPLESEPPLVVKAGASGNGGGDASDTDDSQLRSPRVGAIKRGFSFTNATSTPAKGASQQPQQAGNGDAAGDGRRPGQRGDGKAPGLSILSPSSVAGSATTPLAVSLDGVPSPHRSEGLFKRGSVPAPASDAANTSLAHVPPPYNRAAERPTATIFVDATPSPAPKLGTPLGDETRDDISTPVSSVRSLLVKDSRFRRSDEGHTGAAAAAAAATAAGSGAAASTSVAGSDTPRLRRQLSKRITLLRTPHRTRWFLFNDSGTHEAHVRVLICYQTESAAEIASEAVVTAPDAASTGSAAAAAGGGEACGPARGNLRVMCRPTPLSHTTLSAKELKQQLANMSSSSRCYVEVRLCPVSSFVAAIPAPTTPGQEEQLAQFKKSVSTAEAVEVFVVLAPGATVYVAEGEVLGYKVDTHLVPFEKSNSVAVLGRLLTPELASSLKAKAEAVEKKGYRHTLHFLASGSVPGSGAPVPSMQGTPTTAGAPALPPLPVPGALIRPDASGAVASSKGGPPSKHAGGTPDAVCLVTPPSTDTQHAAPPDSRRLTLTLPPSNAQYSSSTGDGNAAGSGSPHQTSSSPASPGGTARQQVRLSRSPSKGVVAGAGEGEGGSDVQRRLPVPRERGGSGVGAAEADASAAAAAASRSPLYGYSAALAASSPKRDGGAAGGGGYSYNYDYTSTAPAAAPATATAAADSPPLPLGNDGGHRDRNKAAGLVLITSDTDRSDSAGLNSLGISF